ncbi:amidohydrolase family protein [Thermohalobacter berrensis]|uniref:Amidohydrolase n=1 Tax=Thermohalobacter berrensis TaxID=99594 RepID=A0A419SWF2_9FIRM|nr:amidohydrolase family protein [Thermohalobacter berrensis]RKD29540.1 amidohydrolase [Thermohalobacter berrensis]
MIDAHIHITLDGINFKKAREKLKNGNIETIVRNIFKKYKENGIYALRDGGDNLGISNIIRKIAKDEGLIYKSPAYAIYKKGCYGKFLGKAINDLEDFKREFDILKRRGLDHLKIPLTGLVNFRKYQDIGEIAFTLKELKYMVDYAKANGIPVMVHVNSSEAVKIAIKAGVTTIEHGYYITEKELYLMAENDVIWVPTLAPLGNLVIYSDEKFKKELPIIERVYNEQIENVNKAYEMGVKIAVGSDSGAYGVYHVKGFYDEIKHLQRAGIKKEKALEMAYKNGIYALNLNKDEIKYLNQLMGK